MATLINKRENIKKIIISKNISSSIGLPVTYSSKIINDVIQILINILKSEKIIRLKNFGIFFSQKKKQRIGRNPKNKKEYNISERQVVVFKISNNLKKKINNDL